MALGAPFTATLIVRDVSADTALLLVSRERALTVNGKSVELPATGLTRSVARFQFLTSIDVTAAVAVKLLVPSERIVPAGRPSIIT